MLFLIVDRSECYIGVPYTCKSNVVFKGKDIL